MPDVHTTYCRNCAALCGLLVEVEDNKILGIRGDAKHPLTHGYCCIKGLASMDLHNGEDRLTKARARRTDGIAIDIDVEQALDEIHERLTDIIAQHGPRAIAMYYGTGANTHSLCHSAMKGWFDLIGSPYIYSSMTLDQSAKWVAAGRMGIFATGKYSAVDADVILHVGTNPLVSHTPTISMSAPIRALREAQNCGMKMIVVDPRRTETARRAVLHLQIRPGEDAALFAGMIHIVLDRGWQDQAFCARFVRSLDELREAVADFTPDYVSARTGIARALIEQATEMFATARRKSAASGTGPNMATDSNVAEHLLEALNALCGGYRRAGDVVRNVQPLFGAHPTREMVIPPNRSWESGPKCRTADIGPLFGEFPAALLPREIIGNGSGDRIRALVVVGGDPLKALGDPDKTLAAFKQLELLVTLDLRPTETAAISHYAIPTSLPYERFDYTGAFDSVYPVTFAQATKPILDRPAGVIDDWEFFWGLARRMGRPLVLKKPMFGARHDQIPGPSLKVELERRPLTEELIRWMSSQHLVRYDDLLAHPQGILLSDHAVIEPAAADDGLRLDLCPPDVAMEIAQVRLDTESDPTFPFRLISRRQLESLNSAYTNASKTRRRWPVNPAFMNPEDMEAGEISNDEVVEISSAHGTVVAIAKGDSCLRRGVISMTHGWGAIDPAADPESTKGAFVGRLVSIEANLQSINYMPRQSAIPVAVRRLM